jgi:hypothetical protein
LQQPRDGTTLIDAGVLKVIRNSPWRRAWVAACLPYLLASLFVDFVHVDPPEGNAPVSMAAPSAAQPTDGSGPACPTGAWLRLGQSFSTPFSFATTAQAVVRPVALPATICPDSPVPLPRALRGPPRPTLG